jgi:hypothetical protein
MTRAERSWYNLNHSISWRPAELMLYMQHCLCDRRFADNVNKYIRHSKKGKFKKRVKRGKVIIPYSLVIFILLGDCFYISIDFYTCTPAGRVKQIQRLYLFSSCTSIIGIDMFSCVFGWRMCWTCLLCISPFLFSFYHIILCSRTPAGQRHRVHFKGNS